MIDECNQFYLGLTETSQTSKSKDSIYTGDFEKGVYIVCKSLDPLKPDTYKVLSCVTTNGNRDKYHILEEGDILQLTKDPMLPTEITYTRKRVIGDSLISHFSSFINTHVYPRLTTTLYNSDINARLLELHHLMDKMKDSVDVFYQNDYVYKSLHGEIQSFLKQAGILSSYGHDSESESD
jgi:hypothetical protein